MCCDEPEPTEEEIKKAQLLCDYHDGKLAPGLDPGLVAVSQLLMYVAHEPEEPALIIQARERAWDWIRRG